MITKQQKIEAYKETIKVWSWLVDNLGKDKGYYVDKVDEFLYELENGCPLCELYIEYACGGCPLQEAGQECGTPGAPYTNYDYYNAQLTDEQNKMIRYKARKTILDTVQKALDELELDTAR